MCGDANFISRNLAALYVNYAVLSLESADICEDSLAHQHLEVYFTC